MRISVKHSGRVAVFDHVETMCMRDLLHAVADEFHLVHGSFKLALGEQPIEMNPDSGVTQMGVVSGDRLFVVDGDNAAITSSAPASSIDASSDVAIVSDDFTTTLLDAMRSRLASALIQITDIDVQGDLVRFHCSHPRSAVLSEVVLVILELGVHACGICTAGVRLPGGSRLFASTIALQSPHANIERVIATCVVPALRRLLLGSENPLANLLGIGSIGETLLAYFDARDLLNFESVDSAICDYSRSPFIDRVIWKRLLKRTYPDVNVEKVTASGITYRQAFERRTLEERKRRAAMLQNRFSELHDDRGLFATRPSHPIWRPANPFSPYPLHPPDPMFPSPLYPSPSSPFFPSPNPYFPNGEIFPSRPYHPNLGQPRMLRPRFGDPFI